MQRKHIHLNLSPFFNLHIDKIFLTHGHHDHCSGIAKLLNSIGEVPVYMNSNDYRLFEGVVAEGKTYGINVVLLSRSQR